MPAMLPEVSDKDEGVDEDQSGEESLMAWMVSSIASSCDAE
jgi:hypothetical protein